MNWLIYGANGFTGKLIVERAIKRGHKPILAGRNASKIGELAKRYNLSSRIFALDSLASIKAGLREIDTIVLAAGPFTFTSEKVVEACLELGINYLDITGESPVFEHIYNLNEQALSNQCALIPGMGYDIVPTDCMASYVASKIAMPESVEIAVYTTGTVSSGTFKTILEMFPLGHWGGYVENGRIKTQSVASESKEIIFNGIKRTVVLTALPDLFAAQRSAQVRNVKTYLAMPPSAIKNLRDHGAFLQKLFKQVWLRKLTQKLGGYFVKGPSEKMQKEAHSVIWAKASNSKDESFSAELTIGEPYQVTAECVVRGLECLAKTKIIGALTPAQAFGNEFILDLPNAKRLDLV